MVWVRGKSLLEGSIYSDLSVNGAPFIWRPAFIISSLRLKYFKKNNQTSFLHKVNLHQLNCKPKISIFKISLQVYEEKQTS